VPLGNPWRPKAFTGQGYRFGGDGVRSLPHAPLLIYRCLLKPSP
jgi:hypothetical protein